MSLSKLAVLVCVVLTIAIGAIAPQTALAQATSGACCFDDQSGGTTDPLCEINFSDLCPSVANNTGQYQGAGTTCEDNDSDNVADVCEHLCRGNACGDPIPTVSAWGFVVIALALAAAGSIMIRRQSRTT